MSLMKGQINGVLGWKWGDAGDFFSGDDALQKAIAQGVAIGDITEEKGAHIGRTGERRKKRKQRRLLKQVIFIQSE